MARDNWKKRELEEERSRFFVTGLEKSQSVCEGISETNLQSGSRAPFIQSQNSLQRMKKKDHKTGIRHMAEGVHCPDKSDNTKY